MNVLHAICKNFAQYLFEFFFCLILVSSSHTHHSCTKQRNKRAIGLNVNAYVWVHIPSVCASENSYISSKDTEHVCVQTTVSSKKKRIKKANLALNDMITRSQIRKTVQLHKCTCCTCIVGIVFVHLFTFNGCMMLTGMTIDRYIASERAHISIASTCLFDRWSPWFI